MNDCAGVDQERGKKAEGESSKNLAPPVRLPNGHLCPPTFYRPPDFCFLPNIKNLYFCLIL